MAMNMTENRDVCFFDLQSNCVMPPRTVSPDASSTNSDSPVNLLHTNDWVTSKYETLCEEHAGLLGTEDDSSDRHSSDGESDCDVFDVWPITADQHHYYESQFKNLQPDFTGLVQGSVAKRFFQKSRLSNEELRQIWYLADVTKDGALSLGEFKVAMHLAVLRRHHIALPRHLPPSLVSIVSKISPISEATKKSPQFAAKEVTEWTRFIDSPTSISSSPISQPVNFNFTKPSVERNPTIMQPVPLRLSPGPEPLLIDIRSDSQKNINDETVDAITVALKSIQRPQPKKPTVPGPGAIPPPPVNSLDDIGCSGPTSLPMYHSKKDPPPPPPRRPLRAHYRSSSLDLNHIIAKKFSNGPPSIPPRTSPNTNLLSSDGQFADFNKVFSSRGAFHSFKKDSKEIVYNGIQAEPESLEERNHYLHTLCQEMEVEYNSLREVRLALQVKLKRIQNL